MYSDYMAAGWSSMVDKVPGQLSPTAKLEALIGGLGIDNQTHVVIYHAGKNAVDMGSATRIYWTFKVLGHDEVSILDGGWAAYVGDPKKPKNIVEKNDNSPQPKVFKASVRQEMIVSKAEVASLMGKNIPLIDMRPSDQFIGVNRHPKALRSGTIPGAVSLPESWVTENNGGSFRSVQTLNALYKTAAV
ncbi:MAG: sulfurtransferase, partial [Gammaproteobacteria bacterium]|nr:sulfurtransferase [Gammaproteobacteria bacterium]